MERVYPAVPPAGIDRLQPELCAGLALVAAWFLISATPLHHDVVWQLWIGRQMVAGENLYSDILEVNPPLWFWIGRLIVAAGTQLDISTGPLLVAFFVVAAGLAMTLSSAVEGRRPSRERGVTYTAVLATLIIMPLPDFGQREHFVLIATIPYCALIARRMEGVVVPTRLAMTVGIFAALGFALKHYFALVPLVLECLLIAFRGRTWRPWRPELVSLLVLAGLYVAAIVQFERDFISNMVPLVQLAYGGYDRPIAQILAQPLISAVLLASCGFMLWGRPRSAFALTALTAAGAFTLAFLLQHKGWRYHAVPALGLIVLAIAAELQHRWPFGPSTASEKAGLASLGAAVFVSFAPTLAGGAYDNEHRAATQAALADAVPGDTVLALSANASTVWPMIEEKGLVWPSRHFTYWMLPAIAWSERNGQSDATMEALKARVLSDAALEIACSRPALILVDTHRGSYSIAGSGFDTRAFFGRHPVVAAALDQYRPLGRQGRLEVFGRPRELRLPAVPLCRRDRERSGGQTIFSPPRGEGRKSRPS